MNTEVSLFQLSESRSVIFRYSTFEGMVGETHHVNTFDLIDNDTLEVVGGSEKRRKDTVNYNILKDWYKRIEGKSRRIEFHRHMRNFNPKHIEHLDECTRAEAISMVI